MPPAKPGRKPSSKPGMLAASGSMAMRITRPASSPSFSTSLAATPSISGVPLSEALKLLKAAPGSSVYVNPSTSGKSSMSPVSASSVSSGVDDASSSGVIDSSADGVVSFAAA